ncbi:MAG: glucose-6-phosphate isomerase [Planctomycetota bacterium]
MAITIDLSGNATASNATGGKTADNYLDQARASVGALPQSASGFLRSLDEDFVPGVQDVAARCGDFEKIVLLGIGGSALGARTILDALAPESTRVEILDNIDPHTIEGIARRLPLDKTAFVVTSKSGSTAETIAQFLFFREQLLANRVKDWQRHFVVITDPERGPLRELAAREGLPTLPVPPEVGGRFSVLTPVGLLPAALCGIDISELIAGAKAMRDGILADPNEHPVTQLAAAHTVLARDGGATIQVLMSYCDRLRTFGAWFAQLWGESLGKKVARGSETPVWRGSTPLPAVGATDQHSLVQLFAEGPADKQYIFVGAEAEDATGALPANAAELHADFGYLAGHSLRELFRAEHAGTIQALRTVGRPVTELTVDQVDARHLGALFVFFETLTAVVGDLYEVDPFDQPGVEAGKIAAFARMGRSGYAEKAAALFGESPQPQPQQIPI